MEFLSITLSKAMLLRNLDRPRLSSGTKLAINKAHVIEATILSGFVKGGECSLPESQSYRHTSCDFKRIQFPVRRCFAISKKQRVRDRIQRWQVYIIIAVFIIIINIITINESQPMLVTHLLLNRSTLTFTPVGGQAPHRA